MSVRVALQPRMRTTSLLAMLFSGCVAESMDDGTAIIEAPNKVTHLGHVTIPIDGL